MEAPHAVQSATTFIPCRNTKDTHTHSSAAHNDDRQLETSGGSEQHLLGTIPNGLTVGTGSHRPAKRRSHMHNHCT